MPSLGGEDLKTRKLWIGCLAEFLATALFVFFVCSSTLGVSTVIRIALTAGFTITTMVFCIGHLTGGHLNPVVTLAFMARGRLSIAAGLSYVVSQFLGGIVGSALLYALTPASVRGTLGVTSPAADISPGQAFGMECILTFVLLLTIYAVTDTNRKLEGYEIPLAIGVAVFICHLVGIPYTGSSLNPARSFGPAVIMNSWKYHWVYWIGPIIGALIGAFFYDFVLSDGKWNEVNPSE